MSLSIEYLAWWPAYLSILGAVLVHRILFVNSEKGRDFQVEFPIQITPAWEQVIHKSPKIKIKGSSRIQCYAPATGAFLGEVQPASKDTIDEAVAKATAAQERWAASTYSDRRVVLLTLLKFLLKHQEEICHIACLDSGKTKVDAIFGEILVTAEKLRWTIDHGEKALRPSSRPTNRLMMYKRNEVIYEPLGVVAACVSWNYPFHNVISPIIAALFTGNAILVKPSEQTAWSGQFFIHLVKAALKACGHSDDLVQNLVCWPDTAPSLTSHSGIAQITFIGSRPVGEKVASSAAKVLTPVCMELGGKDAAIVLDSALSSDCQTRRVTDILVRGTFQSAGQNCIGIERILATPEAYDKLVHSLPEIVSNLRVGNALEATSTESDVVDVGALVSNVNFDSLEEIIEEAILAGATLLAGTGKRIHHPKHPEGNYFSPTLLANVDSTMRIANHELFAPVMTLMKVSSAEEALKITNSTAESYALGASVFGNPSSKEVHRLVHGIRSGMVSVNDFGVYYAVGMPFGGVRGSGYGRFGGEEGLQSLSNIKAVSWDRFEPIPLRTSIPDPLRLPYKDKKRAWDAASGVVLFGYDRLLSASWWDGVRRLAGL